MDHKTFLEKVAAEANLDKDAASALLDAFVGIMESALANGDVISIPSFGNFEARKRNERIMSNPSQPGKRLLIPPKVVASFKPSAILKNRLNKSEK